MNVLVRGLRVLRGGRDDDPALSHRWRRGQVGGVVVPAFGRSEGPGDVLPFPDQTALAGQGPVLADVLDALIGDLEAMLARGRGAMTLCRAVVPVGVDVEVVERRLRDFLLTRGMTQVELRVDHRAEGPRISIARFEP